MDSAAANTSIGRILSPRRSKRFGPRFTRIWPESVASDRAVGTRWESFSMTPHESPSRKMDDLFADVAPLEETVKLADGATLFRGCASEIAPFIVEAISQIAKTSPFRHMVTPGGYTMSVAMTNCGRAGWTTDRKGYRYATIDPETNAPWPAMPLAFQRLAEMTAERAGFSRFKPDSCLITRY